MPLPRAPVDGNRHPWLKHRPSSHLLCLAGASLHARDTHGVVPLVLAAALGRADTVKTLIALGASVNATASHGTTALMFASGRGHAEIVQQLLRAGARWDAVSAGGETALSLARAGGHKQVAAALERCAFTHAILDSVPDAGLPPSTLSTLYPLPRPRSTKRPPTCSPGQVSSAPARARSPGPGCAVPAATPPQPQHQPTTPRAPITMPNPSDAAAQLAPPLGRVTTELHDAVRSGSVDRTVALLTAGASVYLPDGDGDTPLHVAAEVGSPAVMERLVMHAGRGLDVPGLSGWTPLMVAVAEQHVGCVCVLVAAGADPNLKVDGVCALDVAIAQQAGPDLLAALAVTSRADMP